MQELIKIEQRTVGDEVSQTVDGRALWEYLKSRQHFADWIKNRIEKYGFTQDVDYIVHRVMNEQNQVVAAEYTLTVTMAKELAMVESNTRGKEVRLYFISCEKAAKKAHDEALLKGQQLYLPVYEELERLRPKARAFDRLDGLVGSVCVSDAAKLLDMPVMQLFNWLSSHKWIFRRGGKWLGFAKKLKVGLLCHSLDTVTDPDTKDEHVFVQLRVTAKGLTSLSLIFNEEGNENG
jgi:anti-repressor protein